MLPLKIMVQIWGGIYSTGSTVKIISSSIDSNIAYWGAGLYSENSGLDIERSNVRFNIAYIEGGAIYQNGNSIDIMESAITRNTGLDFGGALVCFMGAMDLDRVTIAGNSSNYGSAFNMRKLRLPYPTLSYGKTEKYSLFFFKQSGKYDEYWVYKFLWWRKLSLVKLKYYS